MAGIAADLLSLASIASLDDPHEMGVIPLLLSLAATGSRVGNVTAVLGHDAHARMAGEVGGPLPRAGSSGSLGSGRSRGSDAGLVKRHRGEGSGRLGPLAVSSDRGDIEVGLVARIVEGGGAGRRRSGGRSERRRRDGIKLEVLAGLTGELKEVHGNVCPLVLDGGRTGEEGIDHVIKLLCSEGREPLQRGPEEGLDHREALESSGGVGS